MNVTIQPATLVDLDDVSKLFDAYRVFYQQQSDGMAAAKFIEQRILERDSVIFLARDEQGVAVGFVQLYPTFSSRTMQRMWTLNDLYVAESAREQGVALQLLAEAKRFSLAGGAKGLVLCTQVSNTKAQALYKKFGFSQIDDFKWYFLST